MYPETVFSGLLEALAKHIPAEAHWIPLLGAATVALVGLVFIFRGARLAPWIVTVLLGGLGALGGLPIAHAAGLMPWPVIAAGAVVGVALGLVLFRLWMGMQVAAILILGGLALYGTRVTEPLSTYVSKEFDTETQQVTLPGAEGTAPQFQPWHAKLHDFWAYMGEQVPGFHVSFIAIVASAGVAGLVFAGLMPKAARSFWAATLGTSLFLIAAATALYTQWPNTLNGLSRWAPLIAGGIWAFSLLVNLVDQLGGRPQKRAEAGGQEASA